MNPVLAAGPPGESCDYPEDFTPREGWWQHVKRKTVHLRGDWIGGGEDFQTACGHVGIHTTIVQCDSWPDDGRRCRLCRKQFRREVGR